MKTTVFLADDHAVVRDGLRSYLQSQPDFQVVGDAPNGRRAVHDITRLAPQIVVMDISMPDLNGVEAARQLREFCPDARVIILSIHANAEYVYRALEAGARGYLLKESAAAELALAIRTVREGRRYLSRKIADLMVRDRLRTGTDRLPDPLQLLSGREREVLQLVVEGRSSAEIAQLLSLSPKTVETYRCRLMEKLGIENIVSLIKFAIQHGVTSLE